MVKKYFAKIISGKKNLPKNIWPKFLSKNFMSKTVFGHKNVWYLSKAVGGCTWGPSPWGKLMVMSQGSGHFKYLDFITIWKNKKKWQKKCGLKYFLKWTGTCLKFFWNMLHSDPDPNLGSMNDTWLGCFCHFEAS